MHMKRVKNKNVRDGSMLNSALNTGKAVGNSRESKKGFDH